MNQQRLRRLAAKRGWRLIKSRVRNTHINNQGGWQVVDNWTNTVVHGVDFELGVENLAVILGEPETRASV